MAVLSIRDVPEAVMRGVKAAAAKSGKTLREYVLERLGENYTARDLKNLNAALPDRAKVEIPKKPDTERESNNALKYAVESSGKEMALCGKRYSPNMGVPVCRLEKGHSGKCGEER